ncbi:MAG: glutamate--tRNA ligase family protein, partial [Patescibacteria group bacterium]
KLVDARYFEYLLTRFTEPNELFGPIDITAFRDGTYRRRMEGMLPEAMVNFLALLGWHPKVSDASEVLSLSELIEQFQLERVQKGGAVFDINKLNWLNKQYLKRKPA